MSSNNFFSKVWRDLAARPDSEHEQALLRVGISAFIFAYLMAFRGSGLVTEQQWRACCYVSISAPFTLALVVGIYLSPGISHFRRVIGMLIDYGSVGALLILGGEMTSPFCVLMAWTTIGHGLRFGTQYLYLASSMSCTVLCLMLLISPYWIEHRVLGIGLLLGVTAIPIYLSSLLDALTRAKEAAQQASAAKSRFLATMSHEFRTPLNGIIGMHELLVSTRVSDEQAEYLAVIGSSSQGMLLLVNDVLDIAAIEAGALKRNHEAFSLSQTLQSISVMLKPMALQKNLRFEVSIDNEVPDALIGDPPHLRQILVNLLHNAIKFTDYGVVTLRVQRGAHETQARLNFTVTDTGPGIAVAIRARIFDAFEQGDSGLARKHGGSGLGTTIARNLVDLLDGEIFLDDNPGGGTRFQVWIPFEIDGSEERANVIAFDDPFVRHRSRVASLRVLIADDQATNRFMLQRILQKAGHVCTLVSDGEELLDRLAVESFDVVLLDLHMPRLSGIDAARQARVMQAGGGKRTPFVAVSADVTVETIKAAREAGISDFIAKPLVVADLLKLLANLSSPKPGTSEKIKITQPSSSREVIDKSMLQELVSIGLGFEFVSTLVSETLNDISRAMDRARVAVVDCDIAALRDASHALKGIAINIGAMKLADACAERMRFDSDRLVMHAYIRQIDALVAEVRTRLPTVVQELRTA